MHITRIFVVFGLLVLAVSLQAQQVRVSVPFNFKVGNQNMPVSNYQIVRISDDDELFALRNLNDTSHAILFHAQPDEIEGQAKLVFDHYGSNYFLSQIVTPDGSYDLQPSRLEQHLAKRGVEHAQAFAAGQ
jgi:hypothetical protein